jgi:hypothetical protein
MASDPSGSSSRDNNTLNTPGGRKISGHAERDSLERHGFRPPFDGVDDIIDNPSRISTQRDGATAFIKVAGRGGNRYAFAILNEDTNTLVTAIKNIDRSELARFGRRYGFNPNP